MRLRLSILFPLLFSIFSHCQAESAFELDQWEIQAGAVHGKVDGWRAAKLPANYSASDAWRGRVGWITLRAKAPAQLPPGPLAIDAGMLSDVSRVYWNDRLIGGLGRATPYQSGAYLYFLKGFPEGIERRAENYVYIELFSDGRYPLQALHQPRLGAADAVFRLRGYADTVAHVLLGIYLVVGLYHLLLAVRRRRGMYDWLFGFFCVTLSLYLFFRVGTRDLIFGNHVLLRTKVEYIALFSLGAQLLLFLSQLFHERYDRVGLVAAALHGALAVATLFGDFRFASNALILWQLSALPLMAYILFYIFRELFRKHPDAPYLAVGGLVLMLGAVHDIAATYDLVPTDPVARFAFFFFVMGIAGALANRFVRVHKRVEELNASLESKVQERTRQLQETLSRVEQLKVQQDGDYFLTSLLISPLGGNQTSGGPVSVESLVRQKKTFRFRRWSGEIGGDLNTSTTISLQQKEFTVFVNGDAMGKSMQGAGGALVLGAVFKAIIARTKQNDAFASLPPELWLRECYQELQNVFVSFDGSMLLSATIGLIDNERGMLYYFNAEHPWVVLYRDGVGRFTDDDWHLRKIGVHGIEGRLRLSALRLQPGDVIITGSDGRDDIAIGFDASGARLINEDENLFLRIVERCNADLAEIETELRRHGEIIDDLTLLRLGFQEDYPPAAQIAWPDLARARELYRREEYEAVRRLIEESAPGGENDPQRAKLLALTLLKARDYRAAAQACESYLRLCPWSDDFLHYQARAWRNCSEIQAAIAAAERLRLRRRDHLENLVNLAELYCLNHDRKAADAALADLRRLPDGNLLAANIELRLESERP